ncbi:MAG: peptidylprolyl isomerase, partial [Sorangiineae bacterium]|nr:peptidylprolyl isomerase [Sorangiineae bacterium]
LASRPLPEGASAPLRRRLVALRCGAAALLAGSATLSRELVACDPEPNGRAGALATVRVLGRAPITRARHRRWLGYAASADSVVREAALGLMPSHPEIEAPAAVLAEALGASAGGVVATAAQLIAAYPSRAAAPDAGRAAPPREPSDAGAEAPRALEVAPEVVQALTRAFDAERPPDAVEVRAALADAAASLGLLSFKPRILALCTSPNDYLRLHAEKALRLLGERERACPRPRPAPSAPPVPSAPPPGAVELVLETDAGSLVLSLDGRLAPLAATRLRELARAGFFDGVVAHRVVPGFVAQFGDPGGDGYGGAGEAPLPSELSPLAFTERAVGVALSAPGTDTGSSQLFVTLGPYPQLDGDYPLIGHASGDWDALASGDVIAKVTVR